MRAAPRPGRCFATTAVWMMTLDCAGRAAVSKGPYLFSPRCRRTINLRIPLLSRDSSTPVRCRRTFVWRAGYSRHPHGATKTLPLAPLREEWNFCKSLGCLPPHRTRMTQKSLLASPNRHLHYAAAPVSYGRLHCNRRCQRLFFQLVVPDPDEASIERLAQPTVNRMFFPNSTRTIAAS